MPYSRIKQPLSLNIKHIKTPVYPDVAVKKGKKGKISLRDVFSKAGEVGSNILQLNPNHVL